MLNPWAKPGSATRTAAAGIGITPNGGLQLGTGLDWLAARSCDPDSRSFLSTDPLPPITGASWSANPYSFAGNDPVNNSDPLGLRPVTDTELQAYRDANRSLLSAAAASASDWWSNNWEYVAAGALIVGGIAVMATGVGGPVGAMMIAGALTGAGGSIWSQKSSTGAVDWGRVAVDGAVGAATGLIGGGAAQAATKATSGITSCLGRNMLSGAVENGINGGASNAITYLTSGKPITVQGLLATTAEGAGSGAVMGAAGGALTKVSGVAKYGCFTPDTQVLMADGTTKPIADVTTGDQVLAYNPDTATTEPRPVTDTHTHHDVATITLTTTAGEITTTTNHPIYAQGRGWTPAGELHTGDQLHTPNGATAEVLTIQPTGKTETVHNLTVEELHNYWVTTTSGTAILVHNNNGVGCGPLAAGDAGSYQDLVSRGTVGDGLTPHHMPQAALGYTSRATGGAIAMTQEQHMLTRTFGGKGIATRAADTGRAFRDVFETDAEDYLKIVGPGGQAHVAELRAYYSNSFPELYGGL